MGTVQPSDVHLGQPVVLSTVYNVTECPTQPDNMPSTQVEIKASLVYVESLHKIFAFGGYNSVPVGHGTKAAYAYDLKANTWTVLASLKHPRYQATSIQLGNGSILVTGENDLLFDILIFT